MNDVFISYARSTAAQAHEMAEALRALGYTVWRDNDLPAHRAYAEVIQERLNAAKAVVVVWSAEATTSEWVQAEADRARKAHKLVQLRIDGAALPMPFDRFQCADLRGWTGDPQAPGWRKVIASLAELTGGADPARVQPAPTAAAPDRRRSICVLPFANMSGDPEQEYFSDGISEDVITDLAKVSALSVVARNTAFTFKGAAVDVRQVARQLNVGHVLEGSVRRAAGRVRITAQLIDGAAGDHVWAERWDRDLTDIFAVQDEISEAIVRALKLKLLPEERRAIEHRETSSADAYDLYLMARGNLISGNVGDAAREEAILRLCRRAVDIDPGYARAWSAMARAQMELRYTYGRAGDDGLAAAERALALDPELADAHAAKARHLAEQGRRSEALAQIEVALHLDPQSYEANVTAARLRFREGEPELAARHYEKAAALMETDFACPGMLITCYTATGDAEGARQAARMTVERAEKVLAKDRSNGAAMGFGAGALAVLGEAARAREWIARALLIDPDNMTMRYNFACALSAHLKDADGALDLLGPYLAQATTSWVNNAKVDPDLDPLRGDPRFQTMIAAAEARLAKTEAAISSTAP